MKKSLKIFIPVLFVFAGCQLITEPDISDENVYILAPVDNYKTTLATHTLWWEHVPDAEGYNIQIVSPDWDAIERLIVDSNVYGNKFEVTLDPGTYSWGVLAYNFSSSTGYSVRTIIIDTSDNLGGQKVVLKSPSKNFSTNKNNIVFEWYALEVAIEYDFQIRYDDWDGSNVVPKETTSQLSTTVTLDEGVYEWGVRASNDNSVTLYSHQTFFVDQTPPGKPTITQPQFNGDSLLVEDVTIKWNRPTESISAISDSLFISTDSTFSEGSAIDIYITQNTEYKLEGYGVGAYFCRIRSFDAAGNIGAFSAIRKFFVSEE